MPLDFAGFEITRLISHKLFAVSDPPKIPDLSSSKMELDDESSDILKSRIIQVVGKDGACLLMDVPHSGSGSTFQQITDLLNAPDPDFIAGSRQLANRLHSHQNHKSIPDGILLVFTGELLDERRFVGLIKAEDHTGFSLERDRTALSLRLLQNIVLSPNQRFYKLAVYVENRREEEHGALRTPSDFDVYIHDASIPLGQTSGARKYFYRSFLGCELSPTSRLLARQFHDWTMEFAKNTQMSEEDRYQIIVSLQAYLGNENTQAFQVDEFAGFVPERLQVAYRGFMHSEKHFPDYTVGKDLSDVKNVLRNRTLNVGAFKLIGPSSLFADQVVVSTQEGDAVIRIIRDRVVD